MQVPTAAVRCGGEATALGPARSQGGAAARASKRPALSPRGRSSVHGACAASATTRKVTVYDLWDQEIPYAQARRDGEGLLGVQRLPGPCCILWRRTAPRH